MTRFVLYAAAVTFIVCSAPIWSGSALADSRVALVIGNSAYQLAPTIPNPTRDAQAIAAEFKKAGFDVVSAYYDQGNLQFKRAIRQFEDAAADADIAVVFYAGHGIEIGGVNYMIPVDAKLASDRDAKDEAIALDRLLEAVDAAKRLGLVILDACRDNPFERTMKRQRVSAVRAVNAGLALIEPTNRNVLIAYASKSGTTAEDGEAEHSPFTAALLKNLFEPGLDLRLAFGRVRDDVLKSTRSRQEPFVYGSLGGTNIALVAAPAKPALAVDLSGERRDYELVEKIGTKGAWNVFITQHPTGFYADLARQQLDKLAAVEDGDALTATRKTPVAGQKLGALEPNKPPSAPSPTSEEQRAWDRIKDSSDAAKFLDFIKRYPSSVLTNTARIRLEALERAAREREEHARVEREAKAREMAEREEQARAEREAKAAEAARQKSEREEQARAEREAQAAEAARQKAERAAALKRADEERLAKLAEAARAKQEVAAEAAQRNAALEEQKQAEREAKAAEAARQKAEREAALKRAEEERLTSLAEAARAKQEAAAEAARQRAEREEQARAEREAKAAEVARQKAAREEQVRAEREAKAAEAARQKGEQEEQERVEREAKAAEAAKQKVEREAAVKNVEEERLAKLSETNRAQEEAACKREEGRLASLKSVRNQSKAREGLRRLEQELTCERLRGSVTAALEKLEQTTTAPERPSRREKARHEEEKPRPVAREKEEKPRPVARQKEEKPRPVARQRDEKPRQAARPQVRQEASSARPRFGGGGGGGGGGGAVIGVGF